MEIEFDEDKRRKVLAERGLDIGDAPAVFAEDRYQIEDQRRDYGEIRYRVWGFLNGKQGCPCLDTARQQTPHHYDETSA